jgi:DNA-binding MarR family transcriptional regulator
MAETRWLDETQQQAWSALMVFVNRGLPELERTLKAHDLLVVHYSMLVVLSAAPSDTMRLSELADAANLSPSRLTHRLRTLVERGIVEIAPDPVDGRGKNATLTPSGRELLESVAPLHAEDVQRLFFDHLTPTDSAHLATALSKVAFSLCDRDDFCPNDL